MPFQWILKECFTLDITLSIEISATWDLLKNIWDLELRLRVVSQLRLASDKSIRIWYSNGGYHAIDALSLCTLCNLNAHETLEHFLIHCPLYSPIRNHYLERYVTGSVNDGQGLVSLLTVASEKQLDHLYYYVTGALKLRAFVINE
uniref:Reverse transcriptase zinc-binding domain-containing protein n=1 Tax=Rhodnius prolixus TaxID=13249 RepID=T1HZZ1_RHOPR